MSRLLSTTQLDAYRRDGFVFPIKVLAEGELARFRAGYETLEAAGGGRVDRDARDWISQPHRHYRWAYELAAHLRVLDAVEDIIGPDILLLDSKFFPKPAHSSTFVSWHQDNTYAGYHPVNGVVTAWIGLTVSTMANGCLRMIPGSDRLGQQLHVKTFATENLLSRGQAVATALEEDQAVPIVLEAGAMSLHNLMVVHSSGPNQTDRKRIGIMIGYVAPYVTMASEEPYPAMLVRGEDRFGHHEHAPIPS